MDYYGYSPLTILLLWAVIGGLIGAIIGNTKGRGGAGFFWGLILGPVGWLIVAAGPSLKQKCPRCGGIIEKGFSKCKHCGSDLTGYK